MALLTRFGYIVDIEHGVKEYLQSSGPILYDLHRLHPDPELADHPNFYLYTMTSSRASMAFWPKQIIPPTPENYKELAKDGAERLAAVSLEQIPAIPAGSVIHDNGCGHGSATAVIMASAAPEVAATYKITGTDISGGAVEVFCDRAETQGWPAQGLVMDSDNLKFPDETFTHTIGNALIFVGPRNNGIDAAKEMYRTLKPGGTLVLNCFAYVPVLEPIREASRVTRTGAILPTWTSFEEWTDPSFIANIVEAGGFKKGVHKSRAARDVCEYRRF